MAGVHILKSVAEQNKKGNAVGMFSVCSANPMVIQASMRHAKTYGYPLIVEATSNQCNQFGGYTGMHPADFVKMVRSMAAAEDLDDGMLILGGDHLGPIVSRKKREDAAMVDASDMVREYVLAGFDKIHIDTSMRLGSDDPTVPLSAEVSAERAAALAQVVEESYLQLRSVRPTARNPVLIVGSEVPVPGGSVEHRQAVEPTDAHQFKVQVNAFRTAFAARNISFEQVVGFVAQPGVEFGDDYVSVYDREKAGPLIRALAEEPSLVLEGHSTDYQPRKALRQLVRDGVAILKVGPALTFSLREGLMLLEQVAGEMGVVCLPGFRTSLEDAMLADGKYWKDYYIGDKNALRFKRMFSYSDRCRYYFPDEQVDRAARCLAEDVKDIPPSLLSMYFPRQYKKYMAGTLNNDGMSVLFDRIGDVLADYAYACFPQLP